MQLDTDLSNTFVKYGVFKCPCAVQFFWSYCVSLLESMFLPENLLKQDFALSGWKYYSFYYYVAQGHVKKKMHILIE